MLEVEYGFGIMLRLCYACRYDPSKYAGQDDDVSDMEVGFDIIQKEERRRYGIFLTLCWLQALFLKSLRLLELN